MRRVLILGLLSCLLACTATPDKTSPSLFAELGGEPGLRRLTQELTREIGRDRRIFPYFAKADVGHFQAGIYSHFCALTDGPCVYRGDSMVDIHAGMNIKEGDFNHLVDLLINAMNRLAIAHPLQNRLLARLARFRGEIIYQ